MICRSGSQIRSRMDSSVYSGYFVSTGPRESKTSFTAWWNSDSPGFRSMTCWYTLLIRLLLGLKIPPLMRFCSSA